MENNIVTSDRDVVIDVINVKKKFKSYQDKASTFKERFIRPSRGKHEDVMVLKGISFQVRRGEALGIIGKNGCGKSTTLKLLTRILYPNEGEIRIKGRVSSLIELGAGFHPDMTGRENIYINASIFGITRKEIDERLNDIIRFSELEDFIDNPVRTYSSGMYMRLAFAVAINVNADVLLIDEILAVGDTAFQKKCFEKLEDIKEKGTTIVIVSHSMDQMYRICDRMIWIEDGFIEEEGIPKVVGEEYLAAMEGKRLERKQEEKRQREEGGKTDSEEQDGYLKKLPTFCWEGATQNGNGKIRLTDGYVLDAEGKKTSCISMRKKFEVVYHYESDLIGIKLAFVISFTKDNGIYCFGAGSISNSDRENVFLAERNGTVKVSFKENNLQDGIYFIDIGIHGVDGTLFHYIYGALKIEVKGDKENEQVGIVNMPRRWESKGQIISQEY